VADEAYAVGLRGDIDAAGLGDAIRLPGEVRDAAVWMRRWDLFVSLSSDEGQGLAVLEAMALGIPVAARPVAGIADFLQDGRNGIAIAQPGAEAAGRAMVRTLAQPALRTRVARAARRLVERRYDWAQTLRRFERLYWQ
jgi:glycosyltransferase involved in cell wall biosynthesis